MSSSSSTTPSSSSSSYERAVDALLSTVHQATTKHEIESVSKRRKHTVQDMRYYWKKIIQNTTPPVTQSKLKPSSTSTSLIHITGTKGKGSTACMCESILRHHGYTTGLLTSPHLIDIRERIRWNGLPIHQSIFATVYWKLRRALERQDDDDDHDHDDGEDVATTSTSTSTLPPKQIMPGYFKMLTLMGLYTFLVELPSQNCSIDVLIVEVGMGGRYDATNYIDASTIQEESDYNLFGRRVCGVTLLDYDHVRILGNTLTKIAWEKGGIFAINKLEATTNNDRMSPYPHSNDNEHNEGDDHGDDTNNNNKRQKTTPDMTTTTANVGETFYILDSNTNKVIQMMESCAKVEGNGGKLQLVDAKGTILGKALNNNKFQLGLAGQHQYGNATLAITLCQAITYNNDKNKIDFDSITTLNALQNASWPARCQTFTRDDSSLIFYLDGAHTPQSMDATVQWFYSNNHKLKQQRTSSKSPILVFNCSHERNPVELLQLLIDIGGNKNKDDDNKNNNNNDVNGITFSHVFFPKSDSTRPSPIAKQSAEELLSKHNIQIRSELTNNDHNNNTKSPKINDDSSTTTNTTRTWQETLAIIWKHLLALQQQDNNKNDKDVDNDDNENNSNNNDKQCKIYCNLTAKQVLKELEKIQQQQQQQQQQQERQDDIANGTATTGPDTSTTSTITTSTTTTTTSSSSSSRDVLVTGSLYLVGSFLTALNWKEESSSNIKYIYNERDR